MSLGIVVLATGVMAGWLGWSVGGAQTTLYVDDVGTVLAALAASLLCCSAGHRQVGALRRFWWLLAAACAAWMLGEVIWAIYDLVLRDAVGVPSWADVGYLSAIPLAVAALLSHPAMAGSAARQARFTLDGLLVATALLFLSWTLVLGPLWHTTDLTTLGGLVAIAYPFGDVVIVFFIVLAVRRMPAGNRLGLWCLLFGLLALALSDSLYAYLTEVQGYDPGSLLDAGWFAGYLAIALGASCSQSQQIAAREPHADAAAPAFAAFVVPFVPILCALGLVAFKPELVQELDPVAFTAAFGLVVLVLARQLLVVRDIAAHTSHCDGTLRERLLAVTGAALPEHSEPAVPPLPRRSQP
ncbi:MAG: hypothetical protein ACRDLS_00180 [Solirubrobacteraceae bacterium]